MGSGRFLAAPGASVCNANVRGRSGRGCVVCRYDAEASSVCRDDAVKQGVERGVSFGASASPSGAVVPVLFPV